MVLVPNCYRPCALQLGLDRSSDEVHHYPTWTAGDVDSRRREQPVLPVGSSHANGAAVLHLVAFAAANPTANALNRLTAIADSVLAAAGTTGLVPSRNLEIAGAYAGADDSGTASLVRALLTAPTLAQVITPAIRPIAPAAVPASDAPLQVLVDHPLPLPAGEAMGVVAEVNAADSTVAAVVLLRDKHDPLPPGPLYTLRGVNASGAVDPTASIWSQIAVDWAQQLPAGRYAIVWMQYAAGAAAVPIAAHLVLADQTLRPGCLAQTTSSALPNRQMQDGVFGVFGTFESFAMPTVEVLQLGVPEADGEFHLGLIRLTDAAGRPCRCG